jgi:hypothetical protein
MSRPGLMLRPDRIRPDRQKLGSGPDRVCCGRSAAGDGAVWPGGGRLSGRRPVRVMAPVRDGGVRCWEVSLCCGLVVGKRRESALSDAKGPLGCRVCLVRGLGLSVVWRPGWCQALADDFFERCAGNATKRRRRERRLVFRAIIGLHAALRCRPGKGAFEDRNVPRDIEAVALCGGDVLDDQLRS